MQTYNSDRTKIIATVGPSCESREVMHQLVLGGVDVFRFNLKHNTLEWHEEKIQQVREIEEELCTSLGVLIDLQGPELRIKTSNSVNILAKSGDVIRFVADTLETINIEGPYVIIPEVAAVTLDIGDSFVLDDGYAHFIVSHTEEGSIYAVAQNAYTIMPNKSLNISQKDLPIPSLTNKDIEKLELAKRIAIDFVALSFVRSKEDIATLRNAMEERGIQANIVAKVESQRGVDNIDEIIDYADAIMIARGDLGIETPIESVTYFQKETIKKCREKSKPVIVATQMLQSMITNPLPTRAEAADISNAVFDRTDCVMLSGETASGDYPTEAAKVMTKIIRYNEEKLPFARFEHMRLNTARRIAQAAVSLTNSEEIHKIVALTETGYTGNVIASLRPKVPIITVSNKKETLRKLSMTYGVLPVLLNTPLTDEESGYTAAFNELKERQLIFPGETILVVHGQNLGVPGNTNTLVIVTV